MSRCPPDLAGRVDLPQLFGPLGNSLNRCCAGRTLRAHTARARAPRERSGRIKTLGEVGRGLFMEWSATSDKFDPSADAKTWESFKPTRTSWRGVFSEAQRMGWINPMSKAAQGANSIPWSNSGSEYRGWLPHQINAANGNNDYVANLEQNIIKLDVPENSFDFLPHYVDKWIPYNEVTLLAGHGGSGKSYVALNIAIHVALGVPFADLPVTQANVMFFSGEDSEAVLRHRFFKLCYALKIEPTELEGKLKLLDASDIDPALYREQRIGQRIVTETLLLDTLAGLVTMSAKAPSRRTPRSVRPKRDAGSPVTRFTTCSSE